MPSAVRSALPRDGITKLTNCRLVRGDALVWEDIWVSSVTGKILSSQEAFYDALVLPDEAIDLGGRIVSPGFIECQLNGAYGFNFSTVIDNNMDQYRKQLRDLNKQLAQTGVTSYIPTVTSQTSPLYKKVLPYLGPSGSSRRSQDGAESLGAHVEGPFLNPKKNGIHNPAVLRSASTVSDLEDMYGASNLTPSPGGEPIPVKMITAAPEMGNMTSLIPSLTSHGIIVSIGHSEATYEEASSAVAAGATMITHLFNAMRPSHHRNPGIFGVLGATDDAPGTPNAVRETSSGNGTAQQAPQRRGEKAAARMRPYFGIIADGIHLHPTTIKIAWNAHPDGCILVTDAMHMVGLPDGRYDWTNGEGEHYIVKEGHVLLLEGTDAIAGSSITLIECVNNFLNWTGAAIPQALKAVTATPAAMLGVHGVKGCLDVGADADLVVLSEETSCEGLRNLVVDEVWKFGARIF
ncbi:putative N-acetylglucosamine-6-phosphate deacetylase [Madurella mycetomatis]|uniref:N-acetylglucosamine-6-phosphate deacetylase n=1 Tax=Madurella mycetomatis TaxID=100816 RepID=A0A175W487_9PEZI|nr:putative N-acetylglucosamine-6-phosphate deacetylase [Madurella mycetomatis]